MKNTFLLLLFFSYIALAKNQDITTDKILSLPNLGKLSTVEFAGYLPIQSQKFKKADGNLFYWYVENKEQAKDSPLVLWLNGGPGAASMYGFFMENGPYQLAENLTLKKRNFSWTDKADYLVIDQPAGVGLSYGEKNCYVNEAEAMDQLYVALNDFFTLHPKIKQKDLYLAGESYAGKYLPQLALRILKFKHNNLHLKGIIIGDAWVNPKVQQAANVDFAYYHGLIDEHDRSKVIKLYETCAKEIDKHSPSSRRANYLCAKIQEYIIKKSGHLNLANISKGIEPEDVKMIAYLNKPAVRKALHVDPRVKTFKTFSESAAFQLEIGEQDSVAELYPELLKAGIKILFYNGLDDGKDSNFLSTQRWLSEMNWAYKKQFNKAKRCVWYTGNQVAGYAKTSNGLTQVTVRNAGHLAPIDQPEILLDLFNRFIQNRTFC